MQQEAGDEVAKRKRHLIFGVAVGAVAPSERERAVEEGANPSQAAGSRSGERPPRRGRRWNPYNCSIA